MIRANVIPPQTSWTNPSPVDFPTGFDYTAHVPPMAIGPQFAPGAPFTEVPAPALGALTAQSVPTLGQEPGSKAPMLTAMLLLLGVGTVIWLATRGPS